MCHQIGVGDDNASNHDYSIPLPVLPSTEHVAVFFFCLLRVLEVFGLNATLICSLILTIIIVIIVMKMPKNFGIFYHKLTTQMYMGRTARHHGHALILVYMVCNI